MKKVNLSEETTPIKEKASKILIGLEKQKMKNGSKILTKYPKKTMNQNKENKSKRAIYKKDICDSST